MYSFTEDNGKICVYCTDKDEGIVLSIDDVTSDVIFDLFGDKDKNIFTSYSDLWTDVSKCFIKKLKGFEIVINVDNHSSFLDFVSDLEKDVLDNVYVNYQSSSACCNFFDYKKMMNKINFIVSSIEDYDLSSMEIIMIVYDIVKAYKYDNLSLDDYTVSRALHNVINNDSCVCAGFSNYFNFLLNELGVKSDVLILKRKDCNVCHQRSFIYVDDDKYDVNGIFLFDPTFDCNRNVDFIDNYNYFMQSAGFFKYVDCGRMVYDEVYKSHDLYKVLDYKKLDIDNIDTLDWFKLLGVVRFLNRFTGSKDKGISFDTSVYKEDLNKYYNLLNKFLGYEDFIRLLYNVRNVEYDMGLIDKKVSKEDVVGICYRRYCNMFKRVKQDDKLSYFRLFFRLSDFDSLFDEIRVKKKIVTTQALCEKITQI